jgi:hypothetical protein
LIYGITAAVASIAVFFFVGGRFYKLWQAGFIGVGIMLLADLSGTGYNFYAYPQGILYLGGIPVFHIAQTYASSILYLNWLPRRRELWVPYTVFVSAIFLVVEAIAHRIGAVIYPNWNLGYSFILLILGLLLLSHLTALVLKDAININGEFNKLS